MAQRLWRQARRAGQAGTGRWRTLHDYRSRATAVQWSASGISAGTDPSATSNARRSGSQAPRQFWVSILARRAPGVSEAQVAARIGAIARPLLEQSMPLRYNAAQRRDYLARRIAVSSGRT